MIRESRHVGPKTILSLLKQKRTHFSVGLIFTTLPFVIGTIFLLVASLTDSDIPDANYDSIRKRGKLTTATITNIETQSNIAINNEHPSIITYKYINKDNNETNGVYRSLDPDKIIRMNVGDTIQIKYLADASMIVGLEPFEFPLDMFKILISFLVIGLVMLTFLYLRIKGQLNLYKQGEVKEAEIVSITPKSGLPISGVGQGLTVYYQYKTTQGQSILGESFTSDYTMLYSVKQGDTIQIFVSVDDESKSCLIPKLEQIRNKWKID